MDAESTPGLPAPTAPTTAEHELAQALAFLGHDARAGHSSTLALLDLQRIQPEPMALPELLARIEANARRSLDTIDDFADLVHARRHALQLDTLELTDLLVEVVADAWSAAQLRGVRVQVAPGAASVVGRADRGLLVGALAKLLRDAVSAAAAGSDIRCSVRAEGAARVVEIAAAGSAVGTDLPGGVPRPSRKVASSLLLARGVAARHGGRVEQTDSAGERCTRLVLPAGDVSDSSSA